MRRYEKKSRGVVLTIEHDAKQANAQPDTGILIALDITVIQVFYAFVALEHHKQDSDAEKSGSA